MSVHIVARPAVLGDLCAPVTVAVADYRVVVRGVPALVRDLCEEVYYEPHITDAVVRLLEQTAVTLLGRYVVELTFEDGRRFRIGGAGLCTASHWLLGKDLDEVSRCVAIVEPQRVRVRRPDDPEPR